MIQKATCRGCGKPIVWAYTADGKKVPLDPRPPAYRVVEVAPDGSVRVERCPSLSADPEHAVMVSHFATCPKASDFSAGRREKGEDRGGPANPGPGY